jgi:hypothetical protein
MNHVKPTLKTVLFSLALLFCCATASQALTETNYNTQNFNTNAGYVRGSGIISTVQPASLRWQGNDPYNTNTFLGETDLIARVSGYTPTPLANSSLIQGGLGVAGSVFPGTNDVRIWKSFTPTIASNWVGTPTVSFFAEWSLIPSLEGAPYNLNDTFSFDLRNAANSLSLLSLQFTPGINIQPNSYTLQTIASGVGTNTLADLAYQSLFQIQADITGSSYNLSLTQINSTNRAVITNITLVTGGSLATGTTAFDLATISLDWDLASGNPAEPGSNYLLANQFLVTTSGTPVPEPGTWAAAALLALTAGYAARRRADARRASAAGN